MEVLSLIIYTKYFWDFDMWPFNRVWPLNGGPLNRGSTVYTLLKFYCTILLLLKYNTTIFQGTIE